MRAWRQVGLLVVLGGALSAVTLGQSVAEAARQQQQRQSKQPAASRVYTNDDFPARLPEPALAPASTSDDGAAAAAARPPKGPSQEEVRSAILAQKVKVRSLDAQVADLQSQLDEWKNANLGNWCPGTYGYYYNPYQGWCETPQFLSLALSKAKAQRDLAQGQLEQMQEEARRLGFRSVVYDPD
ncbi:MAG TPA: hypothetical protein VE825_14455 [Terriglobales bacterium]|jgi:hypothetical protein|nr:hypothetical protein [Terriglobales bacterium]